MKLYTPEAGELATIERLEVRGSSLIIKGEIFGAMPMEAVLTPEEARRAFKLLDPRLILFLLTLPFRVSRKAAD